MKKIDSILDACNNAIEDVLLSDQNSVVMGADFVNLKEELDVSVKNRYYEMGIAEQNLIGAASGMNDNGVVPIVYAFCSFLAYRAYEFIRTDICMMQKNVKMVGIGAGIDFCFAGPSHHATEDLGALRALPGLDVIYPATPLETYFYVREMMKHERPVFIRIEREKGTELFEGEYPAFYGQAIQLRTGGDLTLVSSGPISFDCMRAAQILCENGIDTGVLHIPSLNPFDVKQLLLCVNNTRAVITVDEHNIVGGVGSAVAEILSENQIALPFVRMGLKSQFAKGYGYRSHVREANGIGVEDIIKEAKSIVGV